MPNILVVGSANMDVVTPVARMPRPGETVLIDDVALVNGGKGANTAVAAARLGGTVRFLGAVGTDAFGTAIRAGLEENGVDCRYLQTVEGGSGTAVILLDTGSGQNSILVGSAANFRVTLPAEDDLFAWADVLLLQLETPTAINVEAARRARAHNVRVILDPAPAQADLPDAFLAACDVVSPNETEIEILTGRSLAGPEDAEAGARKLMERGAKEVLVKMGETGALWVTAAGAQAYPAFQIDPVDTTAAGDAFTAAFAVAAALDKPPATVMREALAAGALTCTGRGAQPSLPTRAALEAFLRERG